MATTLKILQQNVNSWYANGLPIAASAAQDQLDVILINDTGNYIPHIPGYITHYKNVNNEPRDGTAILVRNGIKHHTINNLTHHNTQAVTIQAIPEPITIATLYLPPRLTTFPFTDLLNLANRTNPTYILGDLNAHHPFLGSNTKNQTGDRLVMLTKSGKLVHLQTPFYTYRTGRTSPDIILTNSRTYHNQTIVRYPRFGSDHYGIQLSLTLNPIIVPIQPRPWVAKTNWRQYRATLAAHPIPTNYDETTEEAEEGGESKKSEKEIRKKEGRW